MLAPESDYSLAPDLQAILEMAINLEMPLLLTGEPGTGKTQLAHALAKQLNSPLEIMRCKSTFQGEEACYSQDSLLRLNDARFGPGDTGRDVHQFFDYILWGPIGRAFRSDERCILLIDEIDKTDSDVQDNLLDVLDQGSFVIREINEEVKAKKKPIILITSNGKRELSDPFLRRCFAHHLAFPSPQQMAEIIAIHIKDIEPKLLETALEIFYSLRQKKLEKPPATSELILWLKAILAQNLKPDELNPMPFPGILLKKSSDLLTLPRDRF